MSAKRLVRLAPLAAVFLVGACSWFTDFKQQPKIDPWETANDTTPFRGNPQNSVPVYGTLAPGYEYSRVALPAVIDSMSGIVNPVPADKRSLENGHKLFAINCMPCHGEKGDGMGTVTQFGFPMIALISDVTKNRTDGYIFGMIRNGRGLMPTYNRIEEPDRWDIVNYVRGLQGKLGTPVPTGAVAPPGVTGDALPGASQMGPTRPAPYYHYFASQAGAPPMAAAAPGPVSPASGIADSTHTPDSTTTGGHQ